MKDTQPPRGVLARALSEPMLHFVIIGLVLFAAYARWGAQDQPVQPIQNVIIVTEADVERLAAQHEAVWNRLPLDTEMAGLLEELVREEVLYREALALGLDRDDTVIRQRLRQKMEFLGEGAATSLSPTDADLERWFNANIDRFSPPPTLTFQQIFMNDPSDAPALLQALAEGADPATLGRSSLLPATISDATASAVDGTFGLRFYDRVKEFPLSTWQGPVASSFGAHLVMVTTVQVATPPTFQAVRDAVLDGWRRETGEQIREAQYQALLARYEVQLPSDAPAQ